jgi:hypothetical protein
MDGTDFTLGLSDDVSGLKLLESLLQNVINRDGFPQDILDRGVNLPAAPQDREFGPGADRKCLNWRGVVTFMRAAHLVLAHPQGMDDLCRTGKK